MNLLSLYRGGSPPGANSPNRLVCYHYPGPILYVGFIHEWMSGGELIVIIVFPPHSSPHTHQQWTSSVV